MTMKLEKKNKAMFQNALPNSSLSQTFRDAIVATRKLGLSYIWIDSLCIVQDSEDDWLNESAQMGKIYENSSITLTATLAEDGNGRCFYRRDTRESFPTRISVERMYARNGSRHPQGENRRHGSRGFPKAKCDLGPLAAKHWRDDVEWAPVNKRAWVLQEVGKPVPKCSTAETNERI
jgi:hypothetical protein